MKKKLNKKFLLLAGIGALFFVGCSSGQNDQMVASSPAPMAQPIAGTAGGGYAWTASSDIAVENFGSWDSAFFAAPEAEALEVAPAERNRMVIMDADIFVITEYFEESANWLTTIVESSGGYISNSSVWSVGSGDDELWRGNYTLRIPAPYFEMVTGQLQDIGTVINFNTRADDVTDRFFDTVRRLEIREQEEERLVAMLEHATNLEEMLELERLITNARVDIERYTRGMNQLENLASFSTIHFTMHEGTEEDIIRATAFWDAGGLLGQMATGVGLSMGFVGDIFLAVITLSIPIAIFGALGFIGFKIRNKKA